MGMTITEKILAKHAGLPETRAGDNIWVEVDVLMTHDVCGPPTIAIFKREFGKLARVWNREKVVIIPDHYIFTSDKHANRNIEILREFAGEQDLPHFYDVGSPRYKGVCHVALPEEGWTRPGEVLFGTDSHTCTAGAFGEFATGIGNTDAAFIMGTGKLWVKVPRTIRFEIEGDLPPYIMAKDIILKIIGEIGVDGAAYCTMEFAGSAVEAMTMEDRMTLCNMVIEAGGKNGIIKADDKTEQYVRQRTNASYEIFENDPEVKFYNLYRFEGKNLEPMVSKPHSPDNKATVGEVARTPLNRAYIGSCTGGKFSDFYAAAQLLKDHAVKIDTFVVPATTEIAQKLQETKLNGRTIIQIFEDAGVKIGQASCAACLGGPSDTFGRLQGEEICISTTNRNFPGRMGSKAAQVYLASPYTVAASAIMGRITDPREFLK
ncbi:MAG: 3-isopropylmalate dehydratase large subunit [Calditrichota bacterium]|jgi:3-isopropylmalate/(R)-2-methylmalate dehydratase large subunit